GSVGVDDFEPAALADPRRQALATRIRVARDQNPSLNALAPQRVAISLLDGRELTLDLPAVLGAPGRPLGRERHLAKFRRAATSGLRPMSARAMDHLQHLVDDLEQLDELRRLVDALVFDSATP
ncbi:MAG: MmgE/PrpD family protein, partial [Gammaproteobacteria bacterium]